MAPVPEAEVLKVSYQLPRDVIIRIWWKRMMRSPRTLGGMATFIGAAAFCFLVREGWQFAGIAILFFTAMVPINTYRSVARAVDGNSLQTDPKTVEFSVSRVVVIGPNWKSEMPWTLFKGFSEDPDYFYLPLSDSGIASIIPKTAFTPKLQQKFREMATARKA
jgi:hypothetical protein